ncbi:sugar transferase [Microbacterium hominis]|uniref:Sugar transferase n=1 Tax=Microbacterium hominis TaxID=162426 RepID=A0A7D4U8X6_9MICO|nr:sugar transferase [Microbacterium hominis]QKJ20346.1 sugar transferase [Microbacterium hominis]
MPPTNERARRETRWPRRYAQRLFYTDAAVVFATLGVFTWSLALSGSTVVSWPDGPNLGYPLVMGGLAVVWLIALEVLDTRDERIVGSGSIEYRGIVNATIGVYAAVALFGFFVRADLSRALFITAAPIGLGLLVFSRWLWRQWLRRNQRRGAFLDSAVVIGDRAKVAHIVQVIERTEGTGYAIVGAITSRGTQSRIAGSIDVIGDYAHAIEAIDRVGADTVILAGADDLDPQSMRVLGWDLAERDIQFIVAPAMTDIAGPRYHARPVAGLPLVHVAYPRLEGVPRVLKRAFDIVGAVLLIVVLSPFFIGAAVAVKTTSAGPLLYHQERIGRNGHRFGMLKFRSMVRGADDQLASLLDLEGASQPLFKVVDDPRITPVGRFLRRHSIDELPQLFNVLRGEMSLVGPRPQRPAEVALYDDAAHRRLLVKPGMSGLWQVSGRSKLSWEDAIRLDLYYVENWSFTQDIQILFRTIRAVVVPGDTAH